MDAQGIQAIAEALIADYERQGGQLSDDDVLRLASKRGLSPQEIEQVLRLLRVEGVDIDANSELGFVPQDRMRGTASASAHLLRQYLKDIGQFRLLTARDEVRLGRRIQAGLQAEEMLLSRSPASPDLDRLVQDGREARAQMVAANLRLVFSIARAYAVRTSLDVLDLAQEGVFGLIRATMKFDPSRGLKFSTYATWWIRQSVLRAIQNKGRIIRMPVHALDSLRRIKLVRRALTKERKGDEPSVQQVAEQLGMDVSKVQFLLDVAEQPISLETPTGAERSATLGDHIPARHVRTPEEVMLEDRTAEAVLEMVDSLTPKQALVLKLRFGLEDGVERTLEQVGDQLGLTRERIRQIQNAGLKRLRHPSRARNLAPFIES